MSAIISECGAYRYRLEREIGLGITTAIVMVNPSTADAEHDDTTIRKLRGFAERNGWGRIIIGNLFALRATDVRELGRAYDPVGPANDAHLANIFADADRVILAWGPVAKQPRAYRGLRWRRAIRIIGHRPVYCIGAPAKCGHPKHPLMLPYDSPITPWSPIA